MTKNDLHYAVVVGIDWYPGVGDLRLPRADAGGFIEWLESDDGGRVPTENIRRVILDDPKPEFIEAIYGMPTGHDFWKTIVLVNDEIRARVAADPDAWKSTRLYIYTAGHGVVSSDGIGAFVFADTDPVRGFWDHAEISECKDYYTKTGRFKEVLVFADCCRDRRPMAPTLKSPLERPPDTYDRGTAVLVLYGAEYGMRSYEPQVDDPDNWRGYFTRALIEGLRGGAADPETGEIKAHALAGYVTETLDALTLKTNFPQRPTVDGDSTLVIRAPGLRVLPRIARKMTLHLPENYTGRVELICEKERAHVWDAADGPVTLELPENLAYAVRPLDGQAPLEDGGPVKVIAKDGDVYL